jgi:class 3 adenylate cyclase
MDPVSDEVTGLRRELQLAHEREAAVRDVIQTIASTTFDLDAVLQTVIDRAVELCHGDSGNISRRDGDVYPVVAFTSHSSDYERLVRERIYRPERGSVMGRSLLERRTVQILDVLADPEYELTDIQKAGGLSNDVRAFDDAEVRLAETFADYVVIGFEGRYDYGAVGNVVILAQRLSDAASPGEILISQRALAAIDERVVSEPLPELELRGFSRPIVAMRLHGLRETVVRPRR